MVFLRNIAIRHKLISIIMLTSIGALLLAGAGFIGWEWLNLRHSMVNNLSTQGEMIADNSKAALAFGDTKDAEETLSALHAEPSILFGCIRNTSGETFARYARDKADERSCIIEGNLPEAELQKDNHHFMEGFLVVHKPIVLDGENIGVVCLQSDLKPMYAMLKRNAQIIFAVILVACLAAYLVSSRLQRIISEPILGLAEVAKTVSEEKDYSARALQQSNDEVGLLIKAFNEMLEQIQQRDSALVGAKEQLEERVRERTGELTVTNEQLTKEVAERERGQRWVEGLNQLKEHLLTSANLEEKLKHITDGVVRIFGADFARIWIIRPGDLCHCGCIHAGVTEGPHMCRHRDRCLHLLASSGRYTHTDGEVHRRVPFGCYKIGRLAPAEASKFVTNTVTQDPQVHDHAWAEELGLVSFAGYPLFAGTDEPMGVLALFNKSPISREEDAMLETVASTTAQVILTAKAEDAVRESKERYRAVVENTRDIIHSMTLDGTVTFISPQVSSLGYSIDEVVGRNIGEFIHPDDRDHVMSDIAVTFERGETPVREFRFLKKDGSHTYVEEACSAIYDGDRTVQVTGSIRDISERKCAEKELEEAHKKLVDASHQAGMAEVAADVLHNVGNVLNSINVSTTLIGEKVSQSKLSNLKKAADMIAEHVEDLGTFLTDNPQGKHIPAYLTKVTRLLIDDQADIVERLRSLAANVEHIKEVIGTQQSYAKASGVEVPTDLAEVLENAIEINDAALERHKVKLTRDFAKLPQVNIDKQRLLQILVNLISNAKYALSKSGNQERLMTIRSYRSGEDRLRIEVIDNGTGIPKENLTKIFRHGFTTKSDGHGFGLHSGALAAKEIGGSLSAYSDGKGRGAKFTLELPYRPVGVVK